MSGAAACSSVLSSASASGWVALIAPPRPVSWARQSARLQHLVIKPKPLLRRAPVFSNQWRSLLRSLGSMAFQWLTQCSSFSLSPRLPRNPNTAPPAAFCRNTCLAPRPPALRCLCPCRSSRRPDKPEHRARPDHAPRPTGSAAPDHHHQSRPGTGFDDHSATRSPPWVPRCPWLSWAQEPVRAQDRRQNRAAPSGAQSPFCASRAATQITAAA